VMRVRTRWWVPPRRHSPFSSDSSSVPPSVWSYGGAATCARPRLLVERNGGCCVVLVDRGIAAWLTPCGCSLLGLTQPLTAPLLVAPWRSECVKSGEHLLYPAGVFLLFQSRHDHLPPTPTHSSGRGRRSTGAAASSIPHLWPELLTPLPISICVCWSNAFVVFE
jgi:hypothetical protein